MKNNKKKKAIIVEFSFMTRLIINEDEENINTIVKKARSKIMEKVQTELSENLCGWYDDEEMPYDGEE